MYKLGGTIGSHQRRGDWFDVMMLFLLYWYASFAVLRFTRELAAFSETFSAEGYGNISYYH